MIFSTRVSETELKMSRKHDSHCGEFYIAAICGWKKIKRQKTKKRAGYLSRKLSVKQKQLKGNNSLSSKEVQKKKVLTNLKIVQVIN